MKTLRNIKQKMEVYFIIPIILLLGLLSSPVEVKSKELVLGVFPRYGLSVTIHNFTPLTNYLSKNINRNIKLVSAKNYDTFWKGIESMEYDIIHVNQYQYIKAHQKFEYDAFAKNEENGSSTIAGIIVTRKDSNIDSLIDLKGKTVVFGGNRMAMQSYIIASDLLEKAGLKKQEYSEKFAVSPIDAILAVYYGSALAAGAADANFDFLNVTKRVDLTQIKILEKGPQLTHLAWAYNKKLPDDLRNKIKNTLINMDQDESGKRALHTAGLTGIRLANDIDYDQHRTIAVTVFGDENK